MRLADDFEVSIFLTETSTRHSLLMKQKHFREAGREGIRSNSNKLTGSGSGGTSSEAITVEDNAVEEHTVTDTQEPAVRIQQEESDEDMLALGDIPVAPAGKEMDDGEDGGTRRRPKRRRANLNILREDDDDNEDEDGLFVDGDDAPTRGIRWLRDQQHDVDIGAGVQLAAPITSNCDKRP